MHTETVTVQRGKTDVMSNRANDTHPVECFFAWGIGSRTGGRFSRDLDHRESSSTTAHLYVKRGADVKSRDRIVRANGEKYTVVGHSLWDQVSPLTGRDYGWMYFQVESTNG